MVICHTTDTNHEYVLFLHISDICYLCHLHRRKKPLVVGRYFRKQTVILTSNTLFKNGVEEGGEGDEDAGASKPEAGGGTNTRVTGLDLVWFNIDDIVLLEVVVGGIDDTGIVEVENMHLLFACGIFTDKLHFVADTINGQVTRLRQSFKDIDLLIVDSEHAWAVDLPQNRDFIVGHSNRNNGIFILIHIRKNLGTDQLFAIRFSQSTHF